MAISRRWEEVCGSAARVYRVVVALFVQTLEFLVKGEERIFRLVSSPSPFGRLDRWETGSGVVRRAARVRTANPRL